MFYVTVVNLTPDARHAAPADARPLGDMSADELVALLETFAEIDPGENNNADPEVRIDARRKRLVIRTAQKKLFLYNSRDPNEPAYVVSAREVIEELDGTAEARRTRPPLPTVPETFGDLASGGIQAPLEFAPRPVPPPRPPPFVLMGLVLVLGSYMAFAELTAPSGEKPPELALLTGTELATEDAQLSGAYMTGTEPGQHGIVILGGGKLELFQVNARGGPGTVYGTYQLSRKKGPLQLATDQPGGMITVVSRDALEFCGETYARVGKR